MFENWSPVDEVIWEGYETLKEVEPRWRNYVTGGGL